MRLFGEMQQQGLQSCGSPVNAADFAGGQTWLLLGEMQQQGLQPNVVT